MKKNKVLAFLLLLILGGCGGAPTQPADDPVRVPDSAAVAALPDPAEGSTRADLPADEPTGSASNAQVDSVSGRAEKKFEIEGGSAIVYVGKDGAGGYENEGESLYRYEPRSGSRKKLMAEYYAVENVQEHRLPDGSTALLVTMVDGGLGANHIAVVHPQKGEVFRETLCKIGDVAGNTLTLQFYTAWAWGVLNEGNKASIAKVKPFKIKTYSLKELLKRPAIVNKNSNEG